MVGFVLKCAKSSAAGIAVMSMLSIDMTEAVAEAADSKAVAKAADSKAA